MRLCIFLMAGIAGCSYGARVDDPENPNIGGWKPTTLGTFAARSLREMRELAVGRLAPEIEGEDLDGVAFKLSDYRGKVVLLSFWGDW